MLSVSFRRNGLEPDSIPLNNFHEEREREREREREKRERRLFYFDLAMHSFFMGPYIRGKE